jgi:PKD repeat protein
MLGLEIGEYSASGNLSFPLFDPTMDGTFYLENTSPTGLPTGNDPRSIFCWIKVPIPTTTQVIFGYGSTGNDSQQTELIYNDSYRELSAYWNQVFSPVAYYSNSDFVLAANTWYLVGATYNSGGLTLYVGVNGRLSSRGCGLGGLSTSGERIRIGLGLHHFSAIENIFKGTVAKAGIWNRELQYNEVRDLFDAGRVNYLYLPSNLNHVLVTHTAGMVARTNHINDFATRNVEIADLAVSESTPAIIGHWPITGQYSGSTVNDTSGENFNATISGASSIVSDTVQSNSVSVIEFDSTDPYTSGGVFTVPHEQALNSFPISISIWVKTTQNYNGATGIVNKYPGSSYNGYLVYLKDGHIYGWYLVDNGNLVWKDGSGLDGGIINDGNWHHVVFTVDTDGAKIYVDCELKDSNLWTGTPQAITNTQDLIIGPYDNFFNGSVYDLRIYKIAISSDDINHIYNFENPDIPAFDSIETSGGFTLQAHTGIIKTLETSNGWALTVCKPTYANIVTSSGAFLEFAQRDYVVGGVVSYWNLNEVDGTRHDSLGNNHLNCVQLYAEIYVASFDVPINDAIAFFAPNPLAISWLWDFGDGNTSTEQNPTHTFENVGTFVVTLSVDGGTKHTTETRSLTVSVTMTAHVPVADFTDNSPKILGQAITFTDTSSYPNGSWSWDFGDGSGTSTDQNPNYTYSEIGTYTVTLTTAHGAASISHDITINAATIEISTHVDLSSYYNVIGLIPEGDAGEEGSGLDGEGPGTGYNGFDQNVLFSYFPSPTTVNGVEFNFQSGNVNNAIYGTGQTISLSGKYDTIYLLGTGVNGNTTGDIHVYYSDLTETVQTQSFSDWFHYQGYQYETIALGNSGELIRSDSTGPVYIYKYKIAIDNSKTVTGIKLPNNSQVIIFSITAANTIPQMNMWLRGDKIIAVDDALINEWNDVSGNGHNAIQENESLQPRFELNVINNLPAIHFFGSSSNGAQYESGNSLTANGPNNGPYSVMAVVKNSTGTGEFSIALSWGQSGGNYNFWTGYISDNSPHPYPGHFIPASDSHNDIYAAPVDDTNWHVSEGIFNGTYLSGWSTSNLATGAGIGASGNHNASSGTLAGSTVNIGCYIDGSYFWNGYIAEIMLFPLALSDVDREAIEAYLITKYDLGNQNEIQQFSFSPTPISGTYTITVNGDTTDPIDWNANTDAIQTAINTAISGNNSSVS